MCKGCQLATDFVPSAYDDPHPADFVETPRHKWRFYLGVANQRHALFVKRYRKAQEELQALARMRGELHRDGRPTIDQQKKVFEAFESVLYMTSCSLALGYYTASEYIDDAAQSLDYFAQTLTGISPKRNDARRARLTKQNDEIETLHSTFSKHVEAEEAAVKSALPDYEEIAPKFVVVSGPGW